MPEEHCSTRVRFTVNLADLKRSSRRLLTRLSDESEAGGDFVVFNATGSGPQIVANSKSEGLAAIVLERWRRKNTSSFFAVSSGPSDLPRAETHVYFSTGQLTVDGIRVQPPPPMKSRTSGGFVVSVFEGGCAWVAFCCGVVFSLCSRASSNRSTKDTFAPGIRCP